MLCVTRPHKSNDDDALRLFHSHQEPWSLSRAAATAATVLIWGRCQKKHPPKKVNFKRSCTLHAFEQESRKWRAAGRLPYLGSSGRMSFSAPTLQGSVGQKHVLKPQSWITPSTSQAWIIQKNDSLRWSLQRSQLINFNKRPGVKVSGCHYLGVMSRWVLSFCHRLIKMDCRTFFITINHNICHGIKGQCGIIKKMDRMQ